MTNDTSINILNNFQYPNLPVSIIWPENPDEVPWFMARLYEQLAFAINSKDNGIFTMAISRNPTLIPNIASTGSYIVNISGSAPYVDPATGSLNYWPSAVFQIMKSDPDAAGFDVETQVQAGTGILVGSGYDISYVRVPDTTGPFFAFINHNMTGITGSFNVNIQGTQ